MPTLIEACEPIPMGDKTVMELVGQRNGESRVSVAFMECNPGLQEARRRFTFDEMLVVISGTLLVTHDHGTMTLTQGQGVLIRAGEWVSSSTPTQTWFVAVCLPAFDPTLVEFEKP